MWVAYITKNIFSFVYSRSVPVRVLNAKLMISKKIFLEKISPILIMAVPIKGTVPRKVSFDTVILDICKYV